MTVKSPTCPARSLATDSMCLLKRDHDGDHDFGVRTIELTTKELWEMRDFIAFACRADYKSKAAQRRMIQLCEHKLLRALTGGE